MTLGDLFQQFLAGKVRHGEVQKDQPDPAPVEEGEYLAAVAAGGNIADPAAGLKGQGQGAEPGRLVVDQQDAKIRVQVLGHALFSSL